MKKLVTALVASTMLVGAVPAQAKHHHGNRHSHHYKHHNRDVVRVAPRYSGTWYQYRQPYRNYYGYRSYYGYRGPVWRGYDNRYYCRRSDGTIGVLIGAATGALIGSRIDRDTGAILGAVIGGVLGNEAVRCR
jgi:hypothetical protein